MFKWWDPIYYWYRNDIESVSVRKGCIKNTKILIHNIVKDAPSLDLMTAVSMEEVSPSDLEAAPIRKSSMFMVD